jgi:hypothetical protein
MYLDFGTGRTTTVFERRGSFLSMTVSPDEQWIVFGEAPPSQAEVMLVENFR